MLSFVWLGCVETTSRFTSAEDQINTLATTSQNELEFVPFEMVGFIGMAMCGCVDCFNARYVHG